MTDESQPRSFELSESDEDAIALGIRIIRRILADERTTPQQIAGIANGLYALQRMPVVTHGISCGFDLNYRFSDEDFSEFRYFGFRVTEQEYEITIGGSVYDQSTGSYSFSEPGWRISVDGERASEGDLDEIEARINEYIALGATFSVSDESDVEME